MAGGQNPDFVLVQAEESASTEAGIAASALKTLAREAGGTLLADVTNKDVDALEPGSTPYTTQLYRFDNEDATDAFWATAKADPAIAPLLADDKMRVLAAQGLPAEGIPGDPLPTAASDFTIPETDSPPGYMFIDGEAYDVDRLMTYREIIFALMLERASYYLVICEADGVRVLSGRWDEKIFAISKWPTVEHGRDFWYCDRYQNEGIPTRSGAGHFHVNLFEGLQ